jgi:serine/threonine-protein kinase
MNLGLATPTEVLDALCFQDEERSHGRKPDRIGQILVDRGVLRPDDVTQIMEQIDASARNLELPGFKSLELIDSGVSTLQFRGYTIGTRKTVLIHILRFGLADSPDDAQRFAADALTLARLDHPNVVKVLSSGELEGVPYLVLENVTGRNLRGELDENGPMAEEEALDLLAQVAAGLAHAHSVDVFHGSLCPEAILLPRIGPVKVTDFAHFDWYALAAARGTTRLDSPFYLSPEQARKSTRATATSDIYSLGATLFHMLTGHPPFRGAYQEVIRQHLKRPAPDPRVHTPGVSRETARLVGAMLAKDPEERPRTMEEIISIINWAGVEHPMGEESTEIPGRLLPRRR